MSFWEAVIVEATEVKMSRVEIRGRVIEIGILNISLKKHVIIF